MRLMRWLIATTEIVPRNATALAKIHSFHAGNFSLILICAFLHIVLLFTVGRDTPIPIALLHILRAQFARPVPANIKTIPRVPASRGPVIPNQLQSALVVERSPSKNVPIPIGVAAQARIATRLRHSHLLIAPLALPNEPIGAAVTIRAEPIGVLPEIAPAVIGVPVAVVVIPRIAEPVTVVRRRRRGRGRDGGSVPE